MTLEDVIGEGDAVESNGAIRLSIEGIESKSRDQGRFPERWYEICIRVSKLFWY
jgi:hypothetical protein